jgi:hypothetical protein
MDDSLSLAIIIIGDYNSSNEVPAPFPVEQ